ncbi:efflux transporter outer membrane subunit [Acidiferrobacter sp.]|uniref:efflux transporter outer membrane subunit n=1 Tax=Acidiferrobacter sp. TaxID=1872107 RepID=UPI00263A10E0|nr:efflux transporter outer membrane subunit [Acidiferrobacter sp.]
MTGARRPDNHGLRPGRTKIPSRIALCALALLSGCAVGPSFHVPRSALPAHFTSVAHNARPRWPSKTWWRGFHSPPLNHFIALAERHNFNIRIAAAELEAANAAVEVAGAPLLPSVSASGSAQWQRVANPGATTTAGRTPSPFYGASVQASYLVDLWGENRDALRAALANAAAARFNRDTVALTEVTAVATTWFQILADRAALTIGLRNLRAAQRLLKQLQTEFVAGTVDAVTVAQQAALVASERANIPVLRSDLTQETQGLGILVGEPPEQLAIPPEHINALSVPRLIPGLPSRLLRRRPDVAQAEANLIAANANVRAAIASFFPSITLTGSANTSSAALDTLLSPGSVLLNAATSITQPLFEGGRLMGNLAVSRAVYREDVAAYEQTVVLAFTNTEQSLTALHYATIEEHRQAQAVKEARRALAAVRAQLAAGIVDVSAVLTAEETLLGDENAYTDAQLTRLDAAIHLYQALGGGWRLRQPRHIVGS